MEALLIAWFLFCLVAISVYVILFVAVIKSAKQKGRSSGLWFFLSICFTPVFCLFILKCIGTTDEKRRELIIEEERLRLKIQEEKLRGKTNAELQSILGILKEENEIIEEESEEERKKKEKKEVIMRNLFLLFVGLVIPLCFIAVALCNKSN